MSRASKITLGITSALSVITVVGVHYIQEAEKAAMHTGVTRDEERQRIKRERQLDFEMQAQLEKELKKDQTVHVATEDIAATGAAGVRGK
ncbi:hypothetical protein DFH27DRAFT_547091 [Peziza echinospora]|nr:hypothetical protein DFH27DRAFT_547091 [Peziza echinospora]